MYNLKYLHTFCRKDRFESRYKQPVLKYIVYVSFSFNITQILYRNTKYVFLYAVYSLQFHILPSTGSLLVFHTHPDHSRFLVSIN